jgi:hypothetical protein
MGSNSLEKYGPQQKWVEVPWENLFLGAHVPNMFPKELGPICFGEPCFHRDTEFFKELEPICSREITNSLFLEEVEDT